MSQRQIVADGASVLKSLPPHVLRTMALSPEVVSNHSPALPVSTNNSSTTNPHARELKNTSGMHRRSLGSSAGHLSSDDEHVGESVPNWWTLVQETPQMFEESDVSPARAAAEIHHPRSVFKDQWRPSDWGRIRDWFGVDLRALALFRMGVGLVSLWDLVLRSLDLSFHYGPCGLFPGWAVSSLRTFESTIHDGSVGWVGALILLQMIVAGAVVVGYRTQVASFMLMLLNVSLINRNPAVHFGGDLVMSACMFWLFMTPESAVRWSLDAVRALPTTMMARGLTPGAALASSSLSQDLQLARDTERACVSKKLTLILVSGAVKAGWAGRHEDGRVMSLGVFGLICGPVLMYVTSALHKSSDVWEPHYTALEWSLHNSLITSELGWTLKSWSRLLWWGTVIAIWMERWVAWALLAPSKTVRTGAALIMGSFHLGTNILMIIGWFPWICCVWLLPHVSGAFIEAVGSAFSHLARRLRVGSGGSALPQGGIVWYDPTTPGLKTAVRFWWIFLADTRVWKAYPSSLSRHGALRSSSDMPGILVEQPLVGPSLLKGRRALACCLSAPPLWMVSMVMKILGTWMGLAGWGDRLGWSFSCDWKNLISSPHVLSRCLWWKDFLRAVLTVWFVYHVTVWCVYTVNTPNRPWFPDGLPVYYGGGVEFVPAFLHLNQGWSMFSPYPRPGGDQTIVVGHLSKQAQRSSEQESVVLWPPVWEGQPPEDWMFSDAGMIHPLTPNMLHGTIRSQKIVEMGQSYRPDNDLWWRRLTQSLVHEWRRAHEDLPVETAEVFLVSCYGGVHRSGLKLDSVRRAYGWDCCGSKTDRNSTLPLSELASRVVSSNMTEVEMARIMMQQGFRDGVGDSPAPSGGMTRAEAWELAALRARQGDAVLQVGPDAAVEADAYELSIASTDLSESSRWWVSLMVKGSLKSDQCELQLPSLGSEGELGHVHG